MVNNSGSSKEFVLALTLLLSTSWRWYHVTHVCGTTLVVPPMVARAIGGGTTTHQHNSTDLNNTNRVPAKRISTSDTISTKLVSDQTTATVPPTARQDPQKTITTSRDRQSRSFSKNRGTNALLGTANSSSNLNKQQEISDKNRDLLGQSSDLVKTELLGGTDNSGTASQREVALLGETDGDIEEGNFTELEEEVTGRYYHEGGATGRSVKGRKYSKYRNHYKSSYKDGFDPGAAGNNAMVGDPVNDLYRPPTTIMMVGNPHTIKGHHDDNGNAKKKEKTDLMSKILPMMIMPFLISTSLIPMMLTSLKFMLLKSLFVGKIAIVLLVINALWRIDNKGGVYSHNVHAPPLGIGSGYNDRYGHGNGKSSAEMDKALNMAHYGYNGDVEYGAYVNKR